MDFPLQEFMDESACYEKLKSLLHSEGFRCPRCQASSGIGVHHYHRPHVPDHRCDSCGRIFNIFTATQLAGIRRQPSEVLLILQGIVRGTPTAQLARELSCSRTALLEFRHQIQSWAQEALPVEALIDPVTEADEMFQNAGEKRHFAPGSRRSATSKSQPTTRSRNLGQRSTGHRRGGRT